jgi:D-glycero-D-manno-heptose 1,7-bisphosphate phosphatase
MARLGADAARTWMIGDGAADLEAGRAAGVHTALVFAANRCELCPLRGGPGSLTPDVHGPDLPAIALGILRRA